jgi:hypothetical protein
MEKELRMGGTHSMTQRLFQARTGSAKWARHLLPPRNDLHTQEATDEATIT